MILSLFHIQKQQKSKINNISKLLKIFTRKEDSEAKDMITNGTLKRPTKTYYVLILQLFLPDI